MRFRARFAGLVRCLSTPPMGNGNYFGSHRVGERGAPGSLDAFAVELLPPGAVIPSAVETNLVNSAVVKAAVAKACDRLRIRPEDVALLLPDPVMRVFVQQFDDFPRSSAEAVPLLRWHLKNSVPVEPE